MSIAAPRTARDFARIELTRRILVSARAQLAAVGPGELSLRAVAAGRGDGFVGGVPLLPEP